MKKLALFSFVLLLVSCLKTRNDVKDLEQKQVMQDQVVTLQRTNADNVSRFSEMEELVRTLNGRIEVLENRLQNQAAEKEINVKEAEAQKIESLKRNELLQEEITKLESQVQTLNQELQAVKVVSKHQDAPEETASSESKHGVEPKKSNLKKSTFDQAEDFFEKKDWKKAILSYQKYRDENPKGKNYASATYKMGQSFYEIGMKDEAKTFYQDVINNYPKSEEAKKAKLKMKGFKTK